MIISIYKLLLFFKVFIIYLYIYTSLKSKPCSNFQKKKILQICASLTYVDFSECKLIRKIPDLSTTPNITKLNLRWCRNLVEIDDSMGHLDKLKVLDLGGCHKLETLPSCLTMKSLTSFNLVLCNRLNKFPDILHEMKDLKSLHLGNCTNELPLSFGNLTGLKDLILTMSFRGQAHLPCSIYNLHIEMLELSGDFIFPKDVEIDRQPLCNSLGCFSKYVFPSLKQLS